MSHLEIKTIYGHEYYYLVYQEQGRTRKKYLGKVGIFPDWLTKMTKNKKAQGLNPVKA